MIRIDDTRDCFNSFLADMREELAGWVTQRIEARLEADVEAWLHRGPHQRRGSVGHRQTGAQCQRCGTRRAQAFSRNGHRVRQVVTHYGVLTFRLPRVVCTCGGSVRIPFSILRPYQRLWDDVVAQVGRWAALGLSLRQMQHELGEQCQTQVGLRKLNTLVHSVRQPTDTPLPSVPPVVLLDAIWVTLLEPTGATHVDRQGRQRPAKAKEKVCILVALGLYPQSGRWGILNWTLAENESQAAWERLLVPLEARGVYRERGLELLIHDGGSGLLAALNLMFPHVPRQRCVFHKLRNLWQAIEVSERLSPSEGDAFKRQIMSQLRLILGADTAHAATERRAAFCQQWQASQPRLVTTLCRDWSHSIAFFRVLARFPTWPRQYLRTTSLLERVNRMLRRLFRAAGAFHSPAGLLAAVARVLYPLRLT